MTIKIIKKRGRPKKVVETSEPVPLEVPPIPKSETSPCYKEEIVALGKKVKRLNDGRDTDSQFHCSVNGEYTEHFDKDLFK